VIRLECGSGTLQEKLGYGPTSHEMRALLAEGMRAALLLSKAELEHVSSPSALTEAEG
jgi:hypothetical protein